MLVNGHHLSMSLNQLSSISNDDLLLNQAKNDELITKISKENLINQDASPVELKELKSLFEARYNQPNPWPKVFPKASLDCEGLAHYLMNGTVGKFEESEATIINQVDVKQIHRPYTCYKIWQPAAPWMEKKWGSVHFFTHLEDGEYISKNGFGEIRFFETFKEMLEKDAFPFGFVTGDYQTTDDIDKAIIGESLIGTIH